MARAVVRRHAAAVLFLRFRVPVLQECDWRGAVLADFDVRGLEIAVDDPLFVRRFERLGDLFRDRQRLVQRNRAARDPL